MFCWEVLDTIVTTLISSAISAMGKEKSAELVSLTVDDVRKPTGFVDWLSRMTMHPIAGFPILLIVLYFGLYKFVVVSERERSWISLRRYTRSI